MSYRTLCLIAPLLALTAATAPAQPFFLNRDDAPAACRKVVANLMDALEAGDAETLRRCIHTERRIAAQQQGLSALIDCIVAQRTLERAVLKRWGASPDTASTIASQPLFSKADRAAVENAHVEVYGEHEATLLLSADVSPIMLRYSRFEGRWRVVLTCVSTLYDGFERTPENGSQKRINYMRHVTTALQQITQKVNGGALTSPDAVRTALQKALDNATRSATRLPLPSADNG